MVCPRCASSMTARYYGPCEGCRSELRATIGGDPGRFVESDYVPKVNVTANAVALKED